MRSLIDKIVNLFREQPIIGNCRHCNHKRLDHRQNRYWDPDYERGEYIVELSCKGKGTGYFGRDYCNCYPFEPIDNLIYLEKYASR